MGVLYQKNIQKITDGKMWFQRKKQQKYWKSKNGPDAPPTVAAATKSKKPKIVKKTGETPKKIVKI